MEARADQKELHCSYASDRRIVRERDREREREREASSLSRRRRERERERERGGEEEEERDRDRTQIGSPASFNVQHFTGLEGEAG